MAEAFQVEVVSADRMVFQGPAVSVVARTSEGDIGILARHEPMLAPVVPSAVEVTTTDGRRVVIAVENGFLSVTPQRVAVIATYAVPAEEVSLADAERELREAQNAVESGDNDEATVHRLQRAAAQVRAVHRVV